MLGTIIFAAASVVPAGSLIIEMIGSIFTGAGFIVAGLKGVKPVAEQESATKFM
ncbi:MAG: hypothetical protein ABGX20_06805 [Bacillus sp. (in: firmicutes)]